VDPRSILRKGAKLEEKDNKKYEKKHDNNGEDEGAV
jgi:hypothetical protein